jgi:hypothetical protein
LKFFGGESFCSQAEFIADLHALLALLKERGGKHFYLIGNLALDEKFFPGSLQNGRKYFQSASEIKGLVPIFTEELLDKWNDYLPDRVHPNLEGHIKLARNILDRLSFVE